MDELHIRHILGVLIIVAITLAGLTVGRKRLFPAIYDAVIGYKSSLALLSDATVPPSEQVEVKFSSDYTNGASQSNVLELSNSGSQSNVLELPKASSDFVGVWGAYTHSTVYSVAPGALVAKGPDRISVTFGREADTIFVASELYTAPDQRIIRRPRARMSDSKEALIEYEARDAELYYVYKHRFKLLGSGKIAYSENVDIYARRSHNWVGSAKQHALLKQLTTPDQRRRFARPSPFEISSGEALADKSFASPGSH